MIRQCIFRSPDAALRVALRGAVRRRAGAVQSAVFGTIPVLRSSATRCSAPGKRELDFWMPRRFFVYILANCRRGVLYVGVTNNLSRRVSQHRAKVVPGFTSKPGVILLVHVEEYGSILEARAREHSLKRWRRNWKFDLIEKDNPDWRDLSDNLSF
jgi:putative endonuclease